jgi:hypothetical protein
MTMAYPPDPVEIRGSHPTRCPGLPGKPCGHPFSEVDLEARIWEHGLLGWREWSPCDEGCEHGGTVRTANGHVEYELRNPGYAAGDQCRLGYFVEARGRHPVEVKCPACERGAIIATTASEDETLTIIAVCYVCAGTGKLLLCAVCAR